MGLRVTLAGRDITPFVQEETIQIKDVLGQGTGPGASSAGRAATAQLLVSLGPAASASGAGQLPSGPVLARMGEIVISDATSQEHWSMSLHANGQFYARSAPLGDGHDAYAGLSTLQ